MLISRLSLNNYIIHLNFFKSHVDLNNTNRLRKLVLLLLLFCVVIVKLAM